MSKGVSLILLISFCFASCVSAQNHRFKISAELTALPDGIQFFLIRNEGANKADTVSRTLSRDGKFSFEGMLKKEGELYFVKMNTRVVKLSDGKISYLTLLLDHSNIILSGNMDQWPDVQIKGSKPTEEYREVTAQYKKDMSQKENGGDGSQNDPESRKSRIYKWVDNWVTTFPDSYASAWLIFRLHSSFDAHRASECYDKLAARVKESYYGVQLDNLIPLARKQREVAIGNIIPEFFIKTRDNKQLSIRDLAGKAKYTLIDFWAWWCAPCRKDVPKMKEVYEDFHSKGFNIISISTDYDVKKWNKAIQEDGTPWIHGIQVGDVSQYIFGLQAIPGYILINQKGEMIEQDCAISVFSKQSTSDGKYVVAENAKGLRKNLYEVIQDLLNSK